MNRKKYFAYYGFLLVFSFAIAACKSSGGRKAPSARKPLVSNPEECVPETALLTLTQVTNLNKLATRGLRVEQQKFGQAYLPVLEIEAQDFVTAKESERPDFIYYQV
mgnify:CR=1 FL=1